MLRFAQVPWIMKIKIFVKTIHNWTPIWTLLLLTYVLKTF